MFLQKPGSLKTIFKRLWLASLALVCAFVLPRGVAAQVIDLADAVLQAGPSVLGIMRFDHNEAVPSKLVGTGFVIHDGQHVITNAHVVRKVKKADPSKTAFFAISHSALSDPASPSGIVKRYRLQLIDKAAAYDLALLKFQKEDVRFPALPIVGSPDLEPPGRAVFSIGFPIGSVLGPFPAVSAGIISAQTPSLSPQLHASQLDPAFIRARRFALYQLDMTAYPGQSGSPLMDANTGHVVGVVNATKVKKDKERVLSDPSGISYAITAAELRTFLLRNGISP